MDGRLLTRLTNAGLLVGVGVGGGHWLVAARSGSALAARVVFIASMVGTGALAAWRERRSRENDAGEEVRGAQPLWLAGGALAGLVLAWVAFRVAYGGP